MKKSIKYRILAWALIIVVGLGLAAGGGWLVLMQMGRARLLNNASSRMPVLSDNLNEDLNSGEEAPEEDWQEDWQDDWVRYDGKIYDYNENILTFVCLGIDVYDEVGDKQRGLKSGQADAIFLLVLNPDIKQMNIIAVDRNTMADFEVYDEEGQYQSTVHGQIALAHGYGDGRELSAESTVKAVSKIMYELPIHGYCAVNMAAVADINDAVGGVDVTVIEDMSKVDKAFVKGEQVHLEGKQAYWYVKYRDITIQESARMRLNRQKQYLVSYVSQAKAAFKSDVTLPIRVFNSISPYMTTDITADEVAYLAGSAAGYTFSEENLIVIPGTTDTSGRFEEFYPDEDELRKIILDVFYTPLEETE